MTLPPAVVDLVRARAEYACEYCGVTETDSAGLLTVDHYHPLTHGGADDPSNLLYCCFRCNLYKSDYWPTDTATVPLWNPRQERREVHFVLLADGLLYPITDVGQVSLSTLRLNRPALVAYRRRDQRYQDLESLLREYQDLLKSSQNLHECMKELLEEQQRLLEQQQTELQRLLSRDDHF